MLDYCGYILLKGLGPILRKLPLLLVLFLGRRLGDLLYVIDPKHRAIAYANLKVAFGKEMSASQLSKLAKASYRAFGQNFIEIFLIPKIDKKYVNKYVLQHGFESIQSGLERGKGVILLGVHAGNWEFANSICSALGVGFMMFVRGQRFPRMNKLLNSYRMQKGMEVIDRDNGARSLVRALKDNKIIGMTMDQGGRDGLGVDFFGKEASVASGAVKLALRYDAALVLGFPTRIKGPYVRAFFEPNALLKRSGDFEKDLRDNLQTIIKRFENYIRQYPQEYFWRYRIWKYSKTKEILILADEKTGHFRQAQAAADIVVKDLALKGMEAKIHTADVRYRSKFAKIALAAGACFGGKYQCQGCALCLKRCLTKDSYDSLVVLNPDIVISAGASLAPVNYVISRQNMAKSVCILRPGFLGTAKFDLVTMPKHDNPPRRKNIVVTSGALNMIDEEYVKTQSEKLFMSLRADELKSSGQFIGLLIGGDAKDFHLQKESVAEVIRQVKSAVQELDIGTLVTTSRRTPKEIDLLIKEEMLNYSRCQLCVIANEKNIPEAIAGILGKADIIIVSGESISMVSEAASSGKYVLVFGSGAVRPKHRRFLQGLAANRYIYIVDEKNLASTIKRILFDKPGVRVLNDREPVAKALGRVL